MVRKILSAALLSLTLTAGLLAVPAAAHVTDSNHGGGCGSSHTHSSAAGSVRHYKVLDGEYWETKNGQKQAVRAYKWYSKQPDRIFMLWTMKGKTYSLGGLHYCVNRSGW